MNIKLSQKDRIRVKDPGDIYQIIKRIFKRSNAIDRDKEHFWMVGMNTAGIILYIELVSMGTSKSTLVEPMNVYRVAVLKGATRVVAIHNHPGGTLEPSEEDLDMTDRLIQVGRILDIILEDHLIISLNDYYSFKMSGQMRKLSFSLKYVPQYQMLERMREFEETYEKERREIKSTLSMVMEENKNVYKQRSKIEQEKDKIELQRNSAVSSLLKEGMPAGQVAKLFGLTTKEVEAIRALKE